MATTARQVINGALKLIGVLDPVETASAEDAQDGLDKLNDILDEWNGTRNMLFTQVEVVASWSGISANIGTGQTINVARPQLIENAFFRIGSIDYDLKIWNKTQYDDIQIKTTATTYPQGLYYDGGSPVGVVFVWPIPAGLTEFHITVLQQLTAFAGLDTSYGLPQGYRKALIYTLAEEMAPLHSREPSPTVVRIASVARRRLAAANHDVPLLSLDSAASGGFNILTNR